MNSSHHNMSRRRFIRTWNHNILTMLLVLAALSVAFFASMRSSMAAGCTDPPGDITAGAATNVVDVQCSILLALWELNNKSGPVPECLKWPEELADQNCDGSINVADIQIIIQYSLLQPLNVDIDADGSGCPDSCETGAVCGNDIVETGEECDDGAANSDILPDACRTDCKLAYCGDGVVDATEVCDGGANNSDVNPDACRTTCVAPSCGDGVTDTGEECDGGANCQADCTFVPAEGLKAGDLVITEIMQNPFAVADNLGEWFEVYNASGKELDLVGLVISDKDTESHTVTSALPLLVQPGAYFVFGINNNFGTNGGVPVGYQYSGFTLGNGDDEVILTSDGVVIDRLDYDGGPTFPDPNGKSMSLDAGQLNADDNDLGAAWCEALATYGAGDFGTPGTANPACPICGNGVMEGLEACDNGIANSDVAPDACRTNCTLPFCGDNVTDTGEECDGGAGCTPDCLISEDGIQPGELVITEIMNNPFIVGDNFGEWFEVKNTSTKTLDLNGLVIKDDGTESHVVQAGMPLFVGPGGFFVFGINADPLVNGGVTVGYAYLTFFLGNTDDEVVLISNGVEVDRVNYDGGVLFPNPNGRSMSLDPAATTALDNDSGDNWCDGFTLFGAGDYGTPGAENPTCPVCGNGVMEGFEACDDNNLIDGDGCESNCTVTVVNLCGNGVLDEGEECDNGVLNSDTISDACRTNCESPSCGDGVVDTGEACDGGEGCLPTCQLVPPALLPGDLVITEIMQNPLAVADTAGEWIEIYNATTAAVDLNGLVLKDDGTDSHTLTAAMPLLVAPGEYFVLGNNGDPATNGGVAVDYVYAAFSLANGDDEVVLVSDGVEVDRVAYDGGPLFPDPNGRAMSLDASKTNAVDNDLGDNWCEAFVIYGAGDLGTPGAANPPCPVCGDGIPEGNEACDDGNLIDGDGCESNCTLTVVDLCGDGNLDEGEQCDDGALNSDSEPDACRTDCKSAFCGDGVTDTGEECDGGVGCLATCLLSGEGILPGDLVITEIMQNPLAVLDAVGEWFEIYNASGKTLDINGLVIKDDGTDTHTIDAGGPLVVAPGAYVVLGNNADMLVNGGVVVQYVYATFTLGNADDEVVLVSNGVEIDRVNYDGGPVFPDPAGRSMSLDPMMTTATDNDSGANWCEGFVLFGAGDFGTPGAANSPCPICGNGELEGFEACDDGNLTDGDGCEADCTITIVDLCGNGMLDEGEECDDGVLNSDTLADACRTNCLTAFCGDGVVDSGEECDGSIGCTSACLEATAQAPMPGDLVITEIMQNPLAAADSVGEWFEILNVSDKTISLNGLVLKDDGADTHTVTSALPLVVAPGAYFVFGINNDPAVNGGVTVNYKYSLFSLGNADDEVVLMSGGQEIDRVNYDGGPLFPDPNGASMNLDPSATTAIGNDSSTNWCTAKTAFGSGDLGTPGAANTTCAVCGNNIVEVGESCDDGNQLPADGCEPDCTLSTAFCGNGTLDEGEECDNGMNNSNTTPDACRTDCTLPVCGDGVVDTGEECDGGVGCLSGCIQAPLLGLLPGDLIITEFMSDPAAVTDANGEWFEIYNNTGVDLDLNGVTLLDLGSDFHVIDNGAPLMLPAFGVMVLGNQGDPLLNGGVVVDYVYSGILLANTEDEIILFADGMEIDSIAYDATFPLAPGVSAQLDPAFLDADLNDLGEAWCVGQTAYGLGDLGTPGVENESCPVCGNNIVENGEECDDGNIVGGDGCETNCTLSPPPGECGNFVLEGEEECDDGNLDNEDGCDQSCNLEGLPPLPGELIITEIMQNPAKVADTAGEWIEIYNSSVFDLNLFGVVLKDADFDTHTISQPVLVPAGGYVVLGPNSNIATNGGVEVNYQYPGAVFTLFNTVDEVILQLEGVVLDAVGYDDGITFPDPNGASSSLDFGFYDTTENDLGANWCPAFTPYGAGDMGTPGSDNPICP